MEFLLKEVFPIWAIEQDTILSKFGDYTVVYEVTKPEIFTLSVENYEAMHQGILKAIRVLPDHSVLHMQDWFVEASYKAHAGGKTKSALARASDRYFHERPYLEHRSYLYLTRRLPHRKWENSAWSGLFRRSLLPRETFQQSVVQEFLDAAGVFERILADAGSMRLRRLRAEELWSQADKAGLLEQYCWLNAPDERACIRDIEAGRELRVGDKICQLFTVADAEKLPGQCGNWRNYARYSTERGDFPLGFGAGLGQLLGCNHIYNQYLFLGNVQATLKRMESKRLKMQSLSRTSRANGVAKMAIDAYLNEVATEQRLPIRAHFNVLAWTDKPGLLPDIKNKVASALAQMGVSPHHETVGAAQIWYAGIPGNAGEMPENETFDVFAEQAVCFLHLETNYRSSPSPVGLRLGDRLTGRPLNVDLSDEPMKNAVITNRNKVIIGPSGSGKSFFCNAMVRTYFEQGTHVVLVDVGHSYKGLCELAGGYYFTYSESDPVRFNPFHLSSGDVLDTEKKESIKTLLLALWKKDSETFRRSEYVALSKALQLYYEKLEANPELFPCFNSFYEFLDADFCQVLAGERVKEKDFDIDNFLFVLKPFYKGGEFDYLLNASEQLDLLEQPFIVFELDNIKDHPVLFPVVTIIIMEVFVSKMRKLQGVRKMILIEEAWKALMKEGFSEYIKYLFKTVRKFFGEAVVVTQEIEDIISSPIVKQAIINNSDCKILLDQSKYVNKFDDIQQLLGLTDKEKALVLSLNKANDPTRRYKEVFIGLGGVLSKVYRTEVSQEEYLAYTTEESEKVKVADYAKRFGSMQAGIEVLAAEGRNEG
ncbi:MAG: TraG family conjugative transposon ATPase [Bacteroidota bacterium]|nr:TraG family conjugative transposon ATPase [Bacteroidota bacterium]